MKIIQIIYSLSSGGAERFVVDLSNTLAKRGEDVTVCTLLSEGLPAHTFYRDELSDKVRCHCLGFSQGFSIAKCMTVHRYLEKERPDVVHCHLNVLPYIYGYALFHRKVRIVHTLHSIASNTVAKGAQVTINRLFYRRTVTPVTISQVCADSYRALYGLEPVTIENGRALDCAASVRSDGVRHEVDALKPTPEAKVFLHIGRFVPAKNHSRLIDSFNELERKGVPFVLLVIGGGFDSADAGPLRDSACPSVHFLGVKHNVGDYFLCADAFCLTSDYEGMPITLIEAFAYGVTPIVTPAGGCVDMVKDGENGYVSDSFSVDSYVKTVERFLARPIDRTVLRSCYESGYDMGICASRYLDLYHRK